MVWYDAVQYGMYVCFYSVLVFPGETHRQVPALFPQNGFKRHLWGSTIMSIILVAVAVGLKGRVSHSWLVGSLESDQNLQT